MVEERPNDYGAQHPRVRSSAAARACPTTPWPDIDGTVAMSRATADCGLPGDQLRRPGGTGRCRAGHRRRRFGRAGCDPEAIDEEAVASHLYTAGMPDPDLLIRTAGEMRVSNFLLWQISYAEIWVTDCCWPDFDEAQLHAAIRSYAARDRRFGGLGQPRREGSSTSGGRGQWREVRRQKAQVTVAATRCRSEQPVNVATVPVPQRDPPNCLVRDDRQLTTAH